MRIPFEILFENADIIAVNKPAGVTVIPARDEPPEQALRQQLQSSRKETLWVVHRLDRDTSGVCVFARTANAHREWNQAFETRQVNKTYRAFTKGVPEPKQGTVEIALHTARKGRMRPAHPGEEGALQASTAYRVLAERNGIAHVELAPHTGRQHQIRVHMRAIGTPLLVDPIYGGEHALCARLTLHALRLVYGGLTLEAPLPEDFKPALEFLAGEGED